MNKLPNLNLNNGIKRSETKTISLLELFQAFLSVTFNYSNNRATLTAILIIVNPKAGGDNQLLQVTEEVRTETH